MADRHLIIDNKSVLWSDDAHDAFETGSAVMAAVNNDDKAGYVEQIGETWTGDLVLVKELARTR